MNALIIDDDLVLSDVIAFTLKREGYTILAAYDGLEGLRLWREESPAIVILDWELPHLSGIEICQQIRSQSTTPIIMLTVRDNDEDIVRALGAGADDYLTKPFSPTQLVARIQAIMRRSGQHLPPKRIIAKGFRLNADMKRLECNGEESVQLTRLEYRLLETLMLHHGQVLHTSTLLDHVWGPAQGDNAMLKQLVYRLRQKIERDPSNPKHIQAVPGIGYTLVEESRTS